MSTAKKKISGRSRERSCLLVKYNGGMPGDSGPKEPGKIVSSDAFQRRREEKLAKDTEKIIKDDARDTLAKSYRRWADPDKPSQFSFDTRPETISAIEDAAKKITASYADEWELGEEDIRYLSSLLYRYQIDQREIFGGIDRYNKIIKMEAKPTAQEMDAAIADTQKFCEEMQTTLSLADAYDPETETVGAGLLILEGVRLIASLHFPARRLREIEPRLDRVRRQWNRFKDMSALADIGEELDMIEKEMNDPATREIQTEPLNKDGQEKVRALKAIAVSLPTKG